jgi:hypothetical protein
MSTRPRYTINRKLVILLPNQPFLDWIKATEAGSSSRFALDEIRRDSEVFLVPESAGDTVEDVEKWAHKRWRPLFEHLLDSWYTDDTAWPQDRSLNLFKSWVEVQAYTFVWDLAGDQPIEIEDWENMDECE